MAKNCPNGPVFGPQGARLPIGPQKGKFRTIRRVQKFNSVGVYVGLEDIPTMYDAENDTFEDLPDTTHDDANTKTDKPPQEDFFNVVNQNYFGNEHYTCNKFEDLELLNFDAPTRSNI